MKDTVKEKHQSQTERSYLQNSYLIKNSYPKYTKNCYNNRKTNKLIKNKEKKPKGMLIKDTQMANMHMKTCSVPDVITEILIETEM